MGFLIRNLRICKLQLPALRDFKTHEVASTVEFLSLEADKTAPNSSKNLPGSPVSALEKDILIDLLKIKTLKGKIKFLESRC